MVCRIDAPFFFILCTSIKVAFCTKHKNGLDTVISTKSEMKERMFKNTQILTISYMFKFQCIAFYD